MIGALAKLGAFLIDHADVIEAIVEAIEAGVAKDRLIEAAKREMTALSDEAMKADLAKLDP